MLQLTPQKKRLTLYHDAQAAALQALDDLRAQIIAHGSGTEDQSFPAYGHIGFMKKTTQKIADVSKWFTGE